MLSVKKNEGQNVSFDLFDSNPELNLMFKEILRLYGPVSRLGTKNAIKNFKIKDIKVTKGTKIVIANTSLHFNPEKFKDPEEFKPDRFKEGGEDARPGYSYSPFAQGQRDCIGRNFGELMVKMLLTHTLKHFKVTRPDGVKHKKHVDIMNMTENPIFNLTPRNCR